MLITQALSCSTSLWATALSIKTGKMDRRKTLSLAKVIFHKVALVFKSACKTILWKTLRKLLALASKEWAPRLSTQPPHTGKEARRMTQRSKYQELREPLDQMVDLDLYIKAFWMRMTQQLASLQVRTRARKPWITALWSLTQWIRESQATMLASYLKSATGRIRKEEAQPMQPWASYASLRSLNSIKSAACKTNYSVHWCVKLNARKVVHKIKHLDALSLGERLLSWEVKLYVSLHIALQNVESIITTTTSSSRPSKLISWRWMTKVTS